MVSLEGGAVRGGAGNKGGNTGGGGGIGSSPRRVSRPQPPLLVLPLLLPLLPLLLVVLPLLLCSSGGPVGPNKYIQFSARSVHIKIRKLW